MSSIDYYKKYGLDKLFNISISSKDFNTRVDLTKIHVSDLIQYDEPDYEERVENLAIELVLDEIDPDRIKQFEEMCNSHDLDLPNREELKF